MLGCNIFRGFPVLMASSLGHFCRHTPIYAFFVVRFNIYVRYSMSKKQPVGSAHEVPVNSSEIFFDEAQFILNL